MPVRTQYNFSVTKKPKQPKYQSVKAKASVWLVRRTLPSPDRCHHDVPFISQTDIIPGSLDPYNLDAAWLRENSPVATCLRRAFAFCHSPVSRLLILALIGSHFPPSSVKVIHPVGILNSFRWAQPLLAFLHG